MYQSFETHAKILANLSLFIFVLLIAAQSPTVSAADYQINCTDRNDASSCTVTGSGGLSENFANTLQELVDIATDGGDAGQSCTETSPDNFLCNIGNENDPDSEVTMQCSVNQAVDTASCRLGQGPLENTLTVNCSAEGEGASCDIVSDPGQILGILDDGTPQTTVGLASALLAGCSAQTGSNEFQSSCAPILAAVQAGDVDAANATLEAIAPLNAEEAIEHTFFTTQATLSHVNRRLARLRNGWNRNDAVDASGLRIFDGRQWLKSGELLADNSDTVTDVSPPTVFDNFGRLGFFLDGSLLSAEHQRNQLERGSDIGAQLLTWGFDYRFTEQAVGGLAFSTASSAIDYNSNRGDVSDLGFLLLAYGGTYINNFYLDGSIGIGGNDYEQTRRLICDARCVPALQGLNQRANSRFGGTQTTFSVAAGYDWFRNQLSVSPFAQLHAIRVDIDSYRETISNPDAVGAGFALDIDDTSYSTASLSLGTKVQYVVPQDWGVFIPHGAFELYKLLDDEAAVIEGSFVGDIADEDVFSVASSQVDDSYFVLSFGGLFQMANGVNAFGNARIIAGNDDLDQLQFTVGARWEL